MCLGDVATPRAAPSVICGTQAEHPFAKNPKCSGRFVKDEETAPGGRCKDRYLTVANAVMTYDLARDDPLSLLGDVEAARNGFVAAEKKRGKLRSLLMRMDLESDANFVRRTSKIVTGSRVVDHVLRAIARSEQSSATNHHLSKYICMIHIAVSSADARDMALQCSLLFIAGGILVKLPSVDSIALMRAYRKFRAIRNDVSRCKHIIVSGLKRDGRLGAVMGALPDRAVGGDFEEDLHTTDDIRWAMQGWQSCQRNDFVRLGNLIRHLEALVDEPFVVEGQVKQAGGRPQGKRAGSSRKRSTQMGICEARRMKALDKSEALFGGPRGTRERSSHGEITEGDDVCPCGQTILRGSDGKQVFVVHSVEEMERIVCDLEMGYAVCRNADGEIETSGRHLFGGPIWFEDPCLQISWGDALVMCPLGLRHKKSAVKDSQLGSSHGEVTEGDDMDRGRGANRGGRGNAGRGGGRPPRGPPRQNLANAALNAGLVRELEQRAGDADGLREHLRDAQARAEATARRVQRLLRERQQVQAQAANAGNVQGQAQQPQNAGAAPQVVVQPPVVNVAAQDEEEEGPPPPVAQPQMAAMVQPANNQAAQEEEEESDEEDAGGVAPTPPPPCETSVPVNEIRYEWMTYDGLMDYVPKIMQSRLTASHYRARSAFVLCIGMLLTLVLIGLWDILCHPIYSVAKDVKPGLYYTTMRMSINCGTDEELREQYNAGQIHTKLACYDSPELGYVIPQWLEDFSESHVVVYRLNILREDGVFRTMRRLPIVMSIDSTTSTGRRRVRSWVHVWIAMLSIGFAVMYWYVSSRVKVFRHRFVGTYEASDVAMNPDARIYTDQVVKSKAVPVFMTYSYDVFEPLPWHGYNKEARPGMQGRFNLRKAVAAYRKPNGQPRIELQSSVESYNRDRQMMDHEFSEYMVHDSVPYFMYRQATAYETEAGLVMLCCSKAKQ